MLLAVEGAGTPAAASALETAMPIAPLPPVTIAVPIRGAMAVNCRDLLGLGMVNNKEIKTKRNVVCDVNVNVECGIQYLSIDIRYSYS